MKDDAIHAKAISQVESVLNAENLAVVGVLGAIVHTTTESVDMGGTTLVAGNYCFVEVKIAVPV